VRAPSIMSGEGRAAARMAKGRIVKNSFILVVVCAGMIASLESEVSNR
jgi:hypothetical protein